jgi:hypothetical protein
MNVKETRRFLSESSLSFKLHGTILNIINFLGRKFDELLYGYGAVVRLPCKTHIKLFLHKYKISYTAW